MTPSIDPAHLVDRRRLMQIAAVLAGSLPPGVAAADDPAPMPAGPGRPPVFALLIHPRMVLMDLVGPLTVFSMMRGHVHLVWKAITPVSTDVGVAVTPTHTFQTCPADVDVLFVPGGLEGSTILMDDPETLAFLADRGSRARYVTSVCTGALVLGAAGLLKGYRATSHWYVRDLLALMGAAPVHERVVRDRNRITAGGVTAGLDFGLELAMALLGTEHAEHIQLALEYDPMPPLQSGSPERAGPQIVQFVLDGRGPAIAAAKLKAEAAGQRLGA